YAISLYAALTISATATALLVLRLVSMAYWSTAASIIRRSLRVRLAWERLRARRKPGTAIAAKSAMIATTIMISTRVKPPRRLLSLFNIANFLFFSIFLIALRSTRFGRALARALATPKQRSSYNF